MRLFGIPGVPLALTLAGLIPFAAGAGVMWAAAGDPVLKAQAGLALLVYGAVILSFLGGVRWGAEVNAQGGGLPRTGLMVLSVLGSLAGWAAVLYGVLGALGWPVFGALALAHLMQGIWDSDGAGRRVATLGAFAALIAGAASYAVL